MSNYASMDIEFKLHHGIRKTTDQIELFNKSLLIRNGVRPLCVVNTLTEREIKEGNVEEQLRETCCGGVVPFIADIGEGLFECGFAASEWVVDTWRWINKNVPDSQKHRLRGLLLGYSVSAISDYEQRQNMENRTCPMFSREIPT